MSRKDSVMVDNIVISVGDSLTTTEKASYEGHGNVGDVVKVHSIKERSSGAFLVGIVSDRQNANWSNLDGQVAPGHGYYFRRRELLLHFAPLFMKKMVIKDSYTFRKLELQGMECNVLAFLPDGKSVFVEFNKDVGGCASDGLGKAGYCLAVPKAILKEIEKSEEKERKFRLKPLTSEF